MSKETTKSLEVGAMYATLLALFEAAKDAEGKVALLSKVLDSLKQTEDAYNDLLESSRANVAQLSAELAKAKTIADLADPGFTLDEVDYKVIGKEFTYKGKNYKVEDLLADEDLQEELVRKRVGFIVPRDKHKPTEE